MSITLTYSHNKSYLLYLTPQEYGHKNGTKTESDNHFKASRTVIKIRCLKSKNHKEDFLPIEEECKCSTCSTVSKAYIHTLMSSKQSAGCHLITVHNVAFQLNLMAEIRSAIKKDMFPDFVRQFLAANFPGGKPDYPGWVIDALQKVGIEV